MTSSAGLTTDMLKMTGISVSARELLNSGLIMSGDFIIMRHPEELESLMITPEEQFKNIFSEYSYSDHFVDSIREKGIINPISISDTDYFIREEIGEVVSDWFLEMLPPFVLINGHHRFMIANKEDMDIPVYHSEDFWGPSSYVDDTLPYSDDTMWS